MVTVGPNKGNPAGCPVRLHVKYMSLRPSECKDFYIRPLQYPKPDIWYAAMPLGRHVLSGVVKTLCDRAGFEGFYTNHSLRATTATSQYEKGLDEQLIAERTGHRSTAIRSYKRTSSDMLKMVDDVVQIEKEICIYSIVHSGKPRHTRIVGTFSL